MIILILWIFGKDIKLSINNNTIYYDSYDEYGWPCDHQRGDTKDRMWVLFE